MSFASKLVIIISFVSTTCKLVLHQDQFNQSYTHNNDIIEKFSIRLVGSEISGIGNVQIRKNHDEWKWVCDDGWNKKSADIVCSMMGYSGSLTPTNSTYFDVSENDAITDFGLDDIYCNGTEKNILLCYHKGWNSHDCNMNEIAGVYCNVNNEKLTNLPSNEYLQNIFDDNFTQKQNIYFDEVKLQIKAIKLNKNSENIGIVEVELNNGKTGIICGDEWTMNEANLVCRYLNMGMAGKILRHSPIDVKLHKLISKIGCSDAEYNIEMCYINLINENKPCSSPNSVASVKCVHNLPDLVMNKTLLQESLILKFVPLYYLQCAMEENCLASTAYAIVRNIKDWRLKYRKLLRFSASFWNFGTADFLPYTDEPEWKWHECHLHYHSIENFAVYYIRDDNGNELAQGHKASFCLEDVKCLPNIRKKYICQGYGKQGISVGCADSYFSNIDCQWVDITDLRPGNYDLVVHVNPDKRVAELNYDNNVVKCSFTYTGTKIRVGGCSFISADFLPY